MLALQAQEEQIMTDFGPEDERLEGIYERMEELDPTKFEVEAAKLLHGLGFDKAMMAKGTKDMSGRRFQPVAAWYHNLFKPCHYGSNTGTSPAA